MRVSLYATAVAQRSRTKGTSRTKKESEWYILPRQKRHRRGVEITLDDATYAKLKRLEAAWGKNRSRVIEKLVMEAPEPERNGKVRPIPTRTPSGGEK
jgi:hypothetical protein